MAREHGEGRARGLCLLKVERHVHGCGVHVDITGEIDAASSGALSDELLDAARSAAGRSSSTSATSRSSTPRACTPWSIARETAGPRLAPRHGQSRRPPRAGDDLPARPPATARRSDRPGLEVGAGRGGRVPPAPTPPRGRATRARAADVRAHGHDRRRDGARRRPPRVAGLQQPPRRRPRRVRRHGRRPRPPRRGASSTSGSRCSDRSPSPRRCSPATSPRCIRRLARFATPDARPRRPQLHRRQRPAAAIDATPPPRPGQDFSDRSYVQAVLHDGRAVRQRGADQPA